MSRVSEILDRKGSFVHTIPHDATVLDAIRKMVEQDVGSLIVMKGESVFGIFTERDYLRRIILQGRASKTTRIDEVTTERLVCVDGDADIGDCMAIMTQERIRHLPVFRGEKMMGLVSIGDLVKQLSKDREIHIRYLTDYIAGKYPA
jgi:CBS domain-containing protein